MVYHYTLANYIILDIIIIEKRKDMDIYDESKILQVSDL